MANALLNVLQAPFAAALGALGGMSDGIRGKVDENEKFSDGKWEDDPLKKSRGGRFFSEYAGVRGGEKVGKQVGGWGVAAGAAYMTGSFLAAFIGAAGLVGAFPIFAAGVLVVAAAAAGGLVGSWAGKHVGRVVGAAIGGVGGSAVGAYSATFRRGYYKDPEKGDAFDGLPSNTPTPANAPSPEQPSPNAPEQVAYNSQPASPPSTPGYDQGSFVGRVNGQRDASRARPATGRVA